MSPSQTDFTMNREVKELPLIEKSEALFKRSAGLIPAGTQTLAKGPGQYVNGVAPKYLVRGKGSHVWDVDGNEYLDYNMAIGPVSLGYAFPEVDTAITAQLQDGITFSMMHPLEVELAELLHEIIPNAEMVRYSKTGADVVSAAVRLARAYTGKNKVFCCGYHGWHDWYISVTDRNSGIPEQTKNLVYTFDYNNLEALEQALDDDVACIVLEPMVFELPQKDFLQEIRSLCNRKGIVLVFDEMWTGFRLSLGGAQEYFGVTADLACFSKAIANGMPLAVLTGKKDIMRLLEKDVFFFTTFGGEALSLAAAIATIRYMQNNNVQQSIAEKGLILSEGVQLIINQLGIDYLKCYGHPCRTIMTFDAKAGGPLLMKSLVQQELFRRGILWSGFHTISYSHSTSDLKKTLLAYHEVLTLLYQAVHSNAVGEMLRGLPVEPVFRKTSNFNMKPRTEAREQFAESFSK